MNKPLFLNILERYQAGTETEEERSLIGDWCGSFDGHPDAMGSVTTTERYIANGDKELNL